ncbi:MAG TPA: DUF892 family protein, partial [Verrucomicrobiales bacterium]|nr:DUF892 family protein [Verrucomicrobiales bacterium]
REQERCRSMEGLLTACEDMIDANAEKVLYDLGIIAACQRVEHFEIAAYGTARGYAESLGEEEDVALLAETLEEEAAANDELNSIATMLQSQCRENRDNVSLRPVPARAGILETVGG